MLDGLGFLAGLLEGDRESAERVLLTGPFGIGEEVAVLHEVVEVMPRGPRHQPRLRAGTRVRIETPLPYRDGCDPTYRVEVLDAHGHADGYWAVVGQENLAPAPHLAFGDRLRALVA